MGSYAISGAGSSDEGISCRWRERRGCAKTRGSFPSDEAAIKLVYLGIRNIETTRGVKLGTGTQGWDQALLSPFNSLTCFRSDHPADRITDRSLAQKT